ncbi:HET-domain-containing protein [Ganoderma leucocontextum]|nr:HET-domain-containing protein [Ganoderma leucocontextum]
MRVLDTTTGQFVEIDLERATYAILSHTWDPAGEQTYHELRDIQRRHHPKLSVRPGDAAPGQSQTALSPIWADPELSPKIREACRVAREKGYRLLWIDSCCIDKTSSSELSETINSMYGWYARAHVCYAFLADVPAEEAHHREGSRFRWSRWFTRGWTLQELIAPVDVVFLARDWTVIGSKCSLSSLVTEITNIDYYALLHLAPLERFSVAERLSWAAVRGTTRVEDRAYSLLGIFDINMPPLYGEGNRAFRRLQEEIMRRIPDQSLFLWSSSESLGVPLSLHTHVGPDIPTQPPQPDTPAPEPELGPAFRCRRLQYHCGESFLAPSLDLFLGYGSIRAVPNDEVIRRLQYYPNLPAVEYNFTPHGIRTAKIPMIPLSLYLGRAGAVECPVDIPLSQWYLVIFGCEHKALPGHLLGQVFYSIISKSNVEFLYRGTVSIGPHERLLRNPNRQFHLFPLSPATLKRFPSPQIDFKAVYIPHPNRDDQSLKVAGGKPHERIYFLLEDETRNALSAQGYMSNLRNPDRSNPATQLTLSSDKHIITIECQHTLKNDGHELTIVAHVKMSPGPHSHSSGGFLHPTTVSWADSCTVANRPMRPWHRGFLGQKTVGLYPPGVDSKPKRMDLDVAFAAKDHYIIQIEVWDQFVLWPTNRSVTAQEVDEETDGDPPDALEPLYIHPDTSVLSSTLRPAGILSFR